MRPEVWPLNQRPDQIDEFINDRVAKTKAAVLWKENMEEVSKRVMSSSARKPTGNTEHSIVGSTGRKVPTCL